MSSCCFFVLSDFIFCICVCFFLIVCISVFILRREWMRYLFPAAVLVLLHDSICFGYNSKCSIILYCLYLSSVCGKFSGGGPMDSSRIFISCSGVFCFFV